MKKAVITILNTGIQLALLVYIAFAVHWAVTVYLLWLAVSIYVLFSMLKRVLIDLETIEGRQIKRHNDFRKELKSKIKEAADRATKAASQPTTRLKIHPNRIHAPETPKARTDRPACEKCMKEVDAGSVIYNKGNCPIHD